MAVLKSSCFFVFYFVEDHLLNLFGLLFRVVLNQHELIWTPVFKKNSRAFTCQVQVHIVKFVVIILSPHASGTLHLFGDFLSLSLAITHKVIKQKSVFVFAFEFKFAQNSNCVDRVRLNLLQDLFFGFFCLWLHFSYSLNKIPPFDIKLLEQLQVELPLNYSLNDWIMEECYFPVVLVEEFGEILEVIFL